jgi:hypothetical protein
MFQLVLFHPSGLSENEEKQGQWLVHNGPRA